MEKTLDGGLILTPSEVNGLQLLLMAEQRRVVDIHWTTYQSVSDLVNEWERLIGFLPDLRPS